MNLQKCDACGLEALCYADGEEFFCQRCTPFPEECRPATDAVATVLNAAKRTDRPVWPVSPPARLSSSLAIPTHARHDASSHSEIYWTMKQSERSEVYFAGLFRGFLAGFGVYCFLTAWTCVVIFARDYFAR